VAAQKLLTEKEAAELLGVSVNTLQAWRLRKCGPPYVKLIGSGTGPGRRPVRYRPEALEKYLEECERR
jgi:Helix-turn-helix domain